jgi:transposase
MKTFGMLPGVMRGLPFERPVEALLAGRENLASIVFGPCLRPGQLRQQIVAFDKAVRALAKWSPACRLLMSVLGIGVLSVLAYVSMVEDPARFASGANATTISVWRN